MNDTARQLRDRHQLQPHPEGGWYRELHRSAILTTRADWQAARSRGAYSFVSCCVGPGFDFADFEMARNHPIEQRPKLPYPELI